MSTWKTIESAPRDGTSVIAYDGNGNGPVHIRWNSNPAWNCWVLADVLLKLEIDEPSDAPAHWHPVPTMDNEKENELMLRDQMIAKLKERVYLGDGVYAYHDGYQIWIDTGEGLGSIALEDEVLAALDLYRKTVADLIAAINAATGEQT